ncbi:poly(A) RNA polymerase, mitochondrial isoform X1 [Bicyclus anynana]|uniref:Poly(A) RNA polymerase, mitochondrial isoform X1 n=1 Tax=Bicyclus anynana TaxID=110368 RepID=A0ABM3LSD1_BICAN|nr:poly(A) RNA polymerase, mitochondrial isoform X1 [Bicyclus anynana]
MSVLLQTGKVYLLRKQFNNIFSKCIFYRKKSDVSRKFVTFDEIVALRRAEARRSLVVQVNSESSFNELHGYCSKYASINDIHHYRNSGGEHFMLIEFNSEENLKDVLKSCSSHQKDVDVMGVQSPFLWFRASSGVREKYEQSIKQLAVKDGSKSVNEEVLYEELLNCDSVSDQIQMLYDRTVLNDIGVRLRYMVARQLEVVFSSLYANIRVQPFGSSVNGFGRMGCDLDLVLSNNLDEHNLISFVTQSSQKHRLVYQEKKSEGARSPSQRHMELLGALLELRVPGAGRVQRILNARVPIVKYSHELADVDCDLCCNNTSGVYMSELLWALGALDARVRPLTGAVRSWARAVALTNAHPGRWLTNFPLTLLVLFFLQQKQSGPILPSLNYLISLAGKEDIRVAEENLNCTFLRDLNKLPTDSYSQNDDDLQTLLFKFFEFYSQFEFQDKAISINEGRAIRKPNSLPLYVVNPLEQSLNVSRNVSYEECERLRLEVRNAAWHLESCLDGHKSDDWGILGLVEQKSSRGLKKLLRVGNSHRLVSVKDLFKDNDDVEPSTEGIRSKMEKFKKVDKLTDTNKEKKSEMRFKNSQTAREVFRIRRNKLI